MLEKPSHIPAAIAMTVTLSAVLMVASCQRTQQVAPTVEAAPIEPIAAALEGVSSDRGEPMGRFAKVNVPVELKPYRDRRRFLAIQLAEAREQKLTPPRDFPELIRSILKGDLVEMESLGDDYVLFGVGEQATTDFFTHYDPVNKKDVSLYPSLDDLHRELDRLTTTLTELASTASNLKKDIAAVPKRDRKHRRALLNTLRSSQRAAAELEEEKRLLESFYNDPRKLSEITNEYRVISDLAADFGGQSYDLTDGEQRRKMKVRLLSFIRPEARKTLLEIARAYKAEFDRPLPVTSLVRTGDYQRLLHRTNPNAARTAIPPHTTGMAFDLYVYFMSAAEQDHLMSYVAQLEREGRVEALREQRDHIHVFAFPDGKPPSKGLIGKSISQRPTTAKRPRTGTAEN